MVAVLKRRTAEERAAYLQGFARAIEMVEKHGVEDARLMLSVAVAASEAQDTPSTEGP